MGRWSGSSRTGWAGWSSLVSLGLSSSSCGWPGMLVISNWTLLSLSWTETHLPCTLVIVRGCMVLAGLLELMLGGGWSPLASPSAGWSACSASTSGSSRLSICVAWLTVLQCCSAWSGWSSLCSVVLIPVPGLVDVNGCKLLVILWNLTHLATALGIVRGCVMVSGVLWLELG